MAPRYVVSACLAGERCRYDGGDNTCALVVRLVEEGRAVPVCPEVMGGLDTPRSPCERVGRKVMNRDGQDVTLAFEQGAAKAVDVARKEGCTAAIIKSARHPAVLAASTTAASATYSALVTVYGRQCCGLKDLSFTVRNHCQTSPDTDR